MISIRVPENTSNDPMPCEMNFHELSLSRKPGGLKHAQRDFPDFQNVGSVVLIAKL